VTVTLKMLEVFNAVVVSGSISKAARRTRLSQPTISQTLARMEGALGTQLILRGGASELRLTPAGEFWFRSSTEMLRQMEEVGSFHDSHFRHDTMAIRLGTTPSLRGRFLGVAARIAVEQPRFSRFEFFWGLSSDEVVNQLVMHRINCAVVSGASVETHAAALHAVPLFDDPIVWAVPRRVPLQAVAEALAGGRPSERFAALGRYVDVAGTPWHQRTESWFRSRMPFAMPYFGCQTHAGALDLVAAGLATCQTPLVVAPSLPASVRRELRFFRLDGFVRSIAFVMPRHLLSLRPFVEFQQRVCDFATHDYQEEMHAAVLEPLPEAAPVALPWAEDAG
jgi:DNA-binding transcriptional LysR family regulator